MTIILNLPPETEQSLLAEARDHGLSLEMFLQNVIATHAASAETNQPLQNHLRESEVDRSIDELFDTVQLPRGVGKGAMLRKNWYR